MMRCLGTAPVVLACLLAAPARAQELPAFWREFDPHVPEMQIFEKREWTENGVTAQAFYYLSEVWQGAPIKVFAYYARPTQGKDLPAILHIHGGGQTAFLPVVIYWAKAGYAALSFDWTGPRKGREDVTIWPTEVKDQFSSHPDPTYSKVYHAVVAARRGITFLEHRPEVDPDKIGIYGVSWGGFLTWLVNGTDSRVKAAIPVYGCGGIFEDGHITRRRLKAMTEAQAKEWSRLYDPAVYVPYQNGPVLFLNPTNDFFGWLDVAVRRIRALNCPKRLALTPNTNHHLAPEIARNARFWMDTYLRGAPAWPRTPQVTLTLNSQGIPTASVDAGSPQDVTESRVYYALGKKYSAQRFWKFAGNLTRQNETLPLPICNVNDALRVFCTVFYRRGIAMSSIPIDVDPRSLGTVKATGKSTNLIDDFSQGIYDWHTGMGMGGVNILSGLGYLALDEDGPNGRNAVKAVFYDPAAIMRPFAIFTRKVSDPRWNGGNSKGLAFYVRSNGEVSLNVTCVENAQTEWEKEFISPCGTIKEEGWKHITLPLESFKDKQKNALASFKDVTVLRFTGRCSAADPVSIALVKWLP